jgi:putative addiction module CopG family antidote
MISLPADLTQMVRARVESGAYDSEEDVLHAAFQLLRAREEEETIASICRGLADVAAGRVKTAEESNAEFRRRFGLDTTE